MARALRALGLVAVLAGCGASARDSATPPSPGAVPATTAAPRAPATSPPRRVLAPGPVERFPASGARDVCPDPPFRLVFPATVRLGGSGVARLFRSGHTEPLDAIDFSVPVRSETIAGRDFRVERPVRLLDERIVELRFRPGATEPGTEYSVALEEGTITSPDGVPVDGLAEPGSWRFSTRAATAALPPELRVASDGKGDFCTLQGALAAIPLGNVKPVTVRLAAGTYHELVLLQGRGNITLRGEGPGKTVLEYTNNERLQEKRGSAYRAVFSAENVMDLTMEHLTIRNLTPQGGSQAEALRVEPGERVVLRDAELVSRQDTLKLSGRIYAERVRVEGNVDYVWGNGTAYFSDSEFHVVERAGWEAQARNDAAHYGYVFVDSRLTAEPGITGHLLARIEADRFPASHVAYVDCRMGDHIAKPGYEVTPPGAPAKGVRFWEAGSRDLDGRTLDLGGRHPASRRLTRAEAKRLRDPAVVLAGWDPLAPRNSGTSGKAP